MSLLTSAAGAVSLFAIWSTPTTSSYYYDLETMTGSLSAGEWESDVPAACGDLAQYQDIVIYGTDGPDEPLPLDGEHPPPGSDNKPDPQPGNKGQVILGLGGDDVLFGGDAKDCLVGGPGDDTIYGNNGSDIILGGLGHDTLYGDNGPDSMDGGDDDDYLNGGKGPDECIGGPGDDELVSCNDPTDPDGADAIAAKTLASAEEDVPSGQSSDPDPALDKDAAAEPLAAGTAADSGAQVDVETDPGVESLVEQPTADGNATEGPSTTTDASVTSNSSDVSELQPPVE
jgi:hypothetical protein